MNSVPKDEFEAAEAPTVTARSQPGAPAPQSVRLAASGQVNAPVPPVMNRDFIVRNRIIELYLAGRLPVRGATAFERFCQHNPQMLDELGLPERVHAALRLLQAGGKPEPWQEVPRKFWQRGYVPLMLALAVIALSVIALALQGGEAAQSREVAALSRQVVERPLDPATGTRTIVLLPTRAGPSSTPATVVGGSAAQLIDLKIDMTHSEFKTFRVTIDRLDQGRVAVLNNMIKDSNGQLRLALNSSALGPGTYQFTIEGLDWHGYPQPDSWISIGVQH